MSTLLLHELLSDLPVFFRPLSAVRFFEPNKSFIDYMKTYDKLEVWDIGAGDGHVADVLYKAGLQVIAIDIIPRDPSCFPVMLSNSVSQRYPEDAVLLFCRPCHSGFVEATIMQGLRHGVRRYVYAGLPKNVNDDLGTFRRKFRRWSTNVGMEGESLYVWEI